MQEMEQETKTYQAKAKHQAAPPCHGSRALLRSLNGKQCYHRSKPKSSVASPGYGNSVLPQEIKETAMVFAAPIKVKPTFKTKK